MATPDSRPTITIQIAAPFVDEAPPGWVSNAAAKGSEPNKPPSLWGGDLKVGPPRPTRFHKVADLEKDGIVGLYAEGTEPTLSPAPNVLAHRRRGDHDAHLSRELPPQD